MISVQKEDFDAGAEIEHIAEAAGDAGAVVSFSGIVRGSDDDDPLIALTIEHYPGMTERQLMRIEADARSRFGLSECLIIHRVGPLKPRERIVLVVTAAAHRQAAFEGAAFLMDYLKTRATFWKREVRSSGVRWVDARASDDDAAARWCKGGN